MSRPASFSPSGSSSWAPPPRATLPDTLAVMAAAVEVRLLMLRDLDGFIERSRERISASHRLLAATSAAARGLTSRSAAELV